MSRLIRALVRALLFLAAVGVFAVLAAAVLGYAWIAGEWTP